MEKLLSYGALALKGAVAIAFLAAGTAKLVGVQEMVIVFENVGFGQWFRYVTGAIEVVSAVLLFVPGMTLLAALLLAATMLGATFTHFFLIGGSAVPAIILLALSLWIGWLNRSQFPMNRILMDQPNMGDNDHGAS